MKWHSLVQKSTVIRELKWPPQKFHSLVPLLLLLRYSVVSNSVTLGTAAHQVSLSFTISQGLLKLMSIELMIPSNHLILCLVSDL